MVRTELEKLLAAAQVPVAGAQNTATAVSLLDAAGLAPATNSTGQTNGGAALNDEMGRLAAQVEQLRQVTSTQVDSLNQNTEAVIRGAASKPTGTSGQISTGVGKVVSNILGGSGLGSLVTGIMGLFGGNNQDPPAPLPQFALPQAVKVDAGLGPGGQFVPVNYAQDGLPRPNVAPAPTQQINVHVNALDSQSILDRSNDIARAVKEAMLNSHSINDVVADL